MVLWRQILKANHYCLQMQLNLREMYVYMSKLKIRPVSIKFVGNNKDPLMQTIAVMARL